MRATSLLAAVLLAAVAVTSANAEEESTIWTQCPDTDPVNATIHVPHESNCSLFYSCRNGVRTLMQCPVSNEVGGKLHFDAVRQICVWPEESNCRISEDVNIVTTEAATEIPEETTLAPEEPIITTEAPEEWITTPAPEEPVITTEAPEDDEVSESEESESSPPTECPEDNEGEAVHIAHESDCGLFYKCNFGEKVLQQCPTGLAFNAAEQVCDWPWSAGCEVQSEEDSESSGTTVSNEDSNEDDESEEIDEDTSSEDSSAPPSESESDETDGSGSTTTEAEVIIPTECPENNEGDAVHIAHPSNCSLFYKCNHGEKVTHACPSGLAFNPVLQVCDWPWSAGCVAQSEEDSESSGTTESHEDSDEDDEGDETDEEESTDSSSEDSSAVSTESDSDETDGSGSTTTEAEVIIPTECPENNEGDAVHIAHESNCGVFYKCNHGEKVLWSCPSGLAFNPILQVCDWPEAVGCTLEESEEVESSTSSSTEDENDDSDESSITEVPSTTEEAVTTEEVIIPTECPESNGSDAVHIAHPSDCNRFYLCNHGSKVEMTCAPGLEFNPVEQVCDWPANAGCVATEDTASDESASR